MVTVGFLADTSVWIDFFHGKESVKATYLEQAISNDSTVHLCPVILQEILQGIREDAHYKRVKRIMLSYPMLLLPPVEASIGAADLYRNLRKKGITIRRSNDCLIAFYALSHKVPILENDYDFHLIASASDLELVNP